MSDLSKYSKYSLVSTGITFCVLLIYYYAQKPDYVMEVDDTGIKIFSYRLAIIYSLLFSSAVGLLTIGVTSLMFKTTSDAPSSIETPSVGSGKSTFGMNIRHSMKCGCI
jgi:hypothetical protein